MYIVVNIGCIECGVSSNIVGIFDDRDTAMQIASNLQETHGWREGGQNSFEVFKYPKQVNKVHEEYNLEL